MTSVAGQTHHVVVARQDTEYTVCQRSRRTGGTDPRTSVNVYTIARQADRRRVQRTIVLRRVLSA